jgi:hypothetical protein
VINGRPDISRKRDRKADQVAVLDTLLVNASSDARMGTFYQTYYWPQMKTAGSGLANNFNDIFDWCKFGQLGLSRTVCGNNCSSPSQSAYLKYTGTVAYIAANPCTGYSSSSWPAKPCH